MLINLRNALMSGKRLPYDAEVEYLESTGTQWIATTTIDDPANNIAQVTFSIPTSTSASMFLFGSSGVRFNFCAARWGSNRYNFGPTGATTPALPISLGEVHTGTYTLDNGQLTYTLDGDSATYASSLVYNNLPFGLFTIYNSSVNKFIGRIYNFKVIRKSDGAVLADYIPVRKGTVGYLYDRVSGKLFGNAGTGDFVLGPDVVPVEYIESTGVQYIDTGIVPDASTGLRILFQHTSASDQYVAGLREGTGNTRWVVGESTSPYLGYGTVYNTTLPARSLNESLLNYKNDGKGVIFVSDRSATHSLSALGFTPTQDIRLFGAKGPSSIQSQGYMKANVKIYSAEITQGDKPVRNYKAIRVGTGSTWEGAMMDVLTRRIYRNAGTGAFTYGNDLKYPIPAS